MRGQHTILSGTITQYMQFPPELSNMKVVQYETYTG